MPEQPRSKVALFCAALYLSLSLAALALPLITGPHANLAGIYAVLIIQPWSTILVWIMDTTGLDSIVFNWGFLLAGALLNSWLIYKLVSWVSGKIRR